ncbi:MAG: hypothetical protein ABIY70_20290 [Capsulimonas sp.]
MEDTDIDQLKMLTDRIQEIEKYRSEMVASSLAQILWATPR